MTMPEKQHAAVAAMIRTMLHQVYLSIQELTICGGECDSCECSCYCSECDSQPDCSSYDTNESTRRIIDDLHALACSIDPLLSASASLTNDLYSKRFHYNFDEELMDIDTDLAERTSEHGKEVHPYFDPIIGVLRRFCNA